jgi:hypothetical protein
MRCVKVASLVFDFHHSDRLRASKCFESTSIYQHLATSAKVDSAEVQSWQEEAAARQRENTELRLEAWALGGEIEQISQQFPTIPNRSQHVVM